MPSSSNFWFIAVIVLFCMGAITVKPHPPAFTDANIIDAIVGEAADQDFPTMVCVAQAIRNRGTLKGVYGFRAPHNRGESAKTWADAAQAWMVTKHHPDVDIIRGAKNFGTFADLSGHNPTIKRTCGDFYFY